MRKSSETCFSSKSATCFLCFWTLPSTIEKGTWKIKCQVVVCDSLCEFVIFFFVIKLLF